MRFKLNLADISPVDDSPPIVSSLSLDVRSGSRVAILGPSGSGKTTVLRAIMGLAASRRIAEEAESTDVEGLRTKGLVGYVPQNALIFPWLSVADNIRLPFLIHNRPPDEARVIQLVKALEIAGFQDTKATMLSGGMAVRVATARALVLKPQLLLIDEAFAALDEFLRYEIWHNVTREMENGITVFVTHNVSDAASFGSHAIVLDGKAPGRSTTLNLRPTLPSYPPNLSNMMSENIHAIRNALHP